MRLSTTTNKHQHTTIITIIIDHTMARVRCDTIVSHLTNTLVTLQSTRQRHIVTHHLLHYNTHFSNNSSPTGSALR
jgi:hypothetical protein